MPLRLGVALRVPLFVALAVLLVLGERDVLPVLLAVIVRLGVAVRVALLLGVPLLLEVGVRVPLLLLVAVVLPLAVYEGVPDGLPDSLAVLLELGVDECVTLRLGVPDRVPVAAGVPLLLKEGVVDTDGVDDAVALELGVLDRVPDDDLVGVPPAVPLLLLVAVVLPLTV